LPAVDQAFGIKGHALADHRLTGSLVTRDPVNFPMKLCQGEIFGQIFIPVSDMTAPHRSRESAFDDGFLGSTGHPRLKAQRQVLGLSGHWYPPESHHSRMTGSIDRRMGTGKGERAFTPATSRTVLRSKLPLIAYVGERRRLVRSCHSEHHAEGPKLFHDCPLLAVKFEMIRLSFVVSFMGTSKNRFRSCFDRSTGSRLSTNGTD
jgi:hypothetical protein